MKTNTSSRAQRCAPDECEPTFHIGDTVKSQRVGRKPAFVGTVREIFRGTRKLQYVVADDAGLLWQREAKELTLELIASTPPREKAA